MKKILIVCYTALVLAFIAPFFLRAAPYVHCSKAGC